MAKVNEGITLGIGVQANQATVLPAVLNATNLITGAATGTDATGILLRSPEDLAKAFERIESEGGRAPGSLSQLSGSFSREDPVVSFTIDAMGSRGATTTPVAGEFNFAEYFERIIAGARLVRGTPTSSNTPYEFAADDTGVFHSLKIWRGTTTNTEAWVLVGCTFNLTWNFTAGEKSTIDVDVIADSVVYQPSETFPTNDLTTAFGGQTGAAPILESAENALDGITRGFQTGTLTLAYDENEIQDSNATGGIINSQGTRAVTFEAVYFRDTGDNDFDSLSDDLDTGTSPTNPVTFHLGQAAGASSIANAQQFDIFNYRMDTTDKVDGDQVLRTLSGRAVIAGSSGFGSGINEEFRLSSI